MKNNNNNNNNHRLNWYQFINDIRKPLIDNLVNLESVILLVFTSLRTIFNIIAVVSSEIAINAISPKY